MTEKQMLTPKLRFPEFRDRRGWDAVNGNKLFDLIDRRPAPPGLPILAITQEQGAVPRDQIDYHVSVTEASIASYKEVQPADFIISLRSFQGGIEYSRVHGICSPAYLVLRRIGDGSDDYFRHLFKTDRFIQQLTRNIEGLRDGKMISYKQFSEQLLPTPRPAEQRKIAACLTSLDELLAAEARKLDALRAHKKGLLQELFPRPGESRPRLRLPEFRDAGEWETRPLGGLLSRPPEYGVNAAAVNYSPDLPTYIRITDIDDDGNFLTENKASVDIDAADNHYLTEGDVVLARTGASVGKWYRYRPDDGRLVFAGFLIRISPDKNKLDSFFLSAFLATRRYWDWVGITSARSGQPGINGTEYASLPIPLPPKTRTDERPAEQQRIAAIFGSLDALIAAQARKLDVLRAHKKGLVQQIFPSPEGV